MAHGFDQAWLDAHQKGRPPRQVAPRTPPSQPSKYHSQKCSVVTAGGATLWFDSKREARRYEELALLAFAGAITALELQPRFELIASNGEICGHYTADFRYTDLERGRIVVEDVKGGPATKTTAYRLRKRWAQACHAITITEV